MGHTYQGPLSLNLFESAQQKLAKPSNVFDLGEDGFHSRVSLLIFRKSTWKPQLLPHQFANVCTFRGLGGSRTTWHWLVGWDVQVNPFKTFMGHRSNTEITRISRSLIRHSPNILFYLIQHRNQLLAIICRLDYSLRYDDLLFRINCYLSVVGLEICSRRRVLHYSRVGVGEVPLHLRLRNDFTYLVLNPLPLVAALADFFSSLLCRLLFLFRSFFFFGSLFHFTLKLCFYLSYLCQPRLSIPQLFWQFITSFSFPLHPVFFFVHPLRFPQQSRDFRFQLLRALAQSLVGQRFPLRCVRLQFCPVDRHVSQFHQSGALTQLQNLFEQLTELFQVPLPKLRYAVVIRVLVTRQYPKRYIVERCLLQLPRRHPSNAISIYQQLHHHHRMIRWTSPQTSLFIHVYYLGKIQLLHYITDIKCQMIIPQPAPHIRRQQKLLFHIVRSECFAHGSQFTYYRSSVHDFFPTDSFRRNLLVGESLAPEDATTKLK